MGFLSSAYSWFSDKVNSTFGSTPPPGMSLNSNGTNLGTPIKFDLSGSNQPAKFYNPLLPGAPVSLKDVNDSIKKDIDISDGDRTRPRATYPTGDHSASEIYYAPVTPAQLDYLNAELASHYGMSKETAYQEALSNTAYQRSVKDMKSAGLNPAVIYGAGKGSPAGGVYGARSLDAEGGFANYGGSGGYSRRSGGSSKNNGKLFSTGEFYGISAAAGLVSAIVSKNPNSYWIGQTVAQGFMTAADSLFRK